MGRENSNAVPIDLEKTYDLPELIDIAERSHPETRAAWEQAQLQAPPPPATSDALEGEQIFMQMSCVNCHAIKGTVGPSRDTARFAPAKIQDSRCPTAPQSVTVAALERGLL